jgi:hypothetical protein
MPLQYSILDTLRHNVYHCGRRLGGGENLPLGGEQWTLPQFSPYVRVVAFRSLLLSGCK